MRFKNVFFIANVDQYLHFEKQYCTQGDEIQSYTTLQAAKEACSDNNECNCIHATACDGDRWYIRKNATLSYRWGACAWTKGRR